MYAHRAVNVRSAKQFIPFLNDVLNCFRLALFKGQNGGIRGADIRHLIAVIGLVPVARFFNQHIHGALFCAVEYLIIRACAAADVDVVARQAYVLRVFGNGGCLRGCGRRTWR